MIVAPTKGSRPRVRWGIAVTEACNAMKAIGTSALLVREGPQGTGFEPLPRNLRDRRSLAVPEPFDVAYMPESGDASEYSDAPVAWLVRCWWQVGGFTFVMPSQRCPALDPALASGSSSDEPFTGFIALKIATTDGLDGQTAEVLTYEDYAEMAEAQRDLDYVIIPLYKVKGGTIEIDMRRMPVSGMLEALPANEGSGDSSCGEEEE